MSEQDIKICGKQFYSHQAPCPRAPGHEGSCYFWIQTGSRPAGLWVYDVVTRQPNLHCDLVGLLIPDEVAALVQYFDLVREHRAHPK